MKTFKLFILIIFCHPVWSLAQETIPIETNLTFAVNSYFTNLFTRLSRVAEKKPTANTFRELIKPEIQNIEGLFGASLINADWVITQVYFKSDFLAIGYNLKKVNELQPFIKKMAAKPEPQLSEPGHGNIFQPRLISLRYPLVENNQMTAMLSVLIRSDAFLKTVQLDTCHAYRITCNDMIAETHGDLSATPKKVKLALPSTTWQIEYE